METKHILFAACFYAVVEVLRWLWDWNERSRARHRRVLAEQTLNARGMSVYPYMPAFGVDDPELRSALAVFEYGGHVVLDKDGRMVGRLMPKVVARGRPAPGLRLVVDNTK